MTPAREAPDRRRSRAGRGANGRAPESRIPDKPVAPISSLSMRPSPWRRRTLRFVRRIAALGAFAAAAFVAYTYVAEPLLGEDETVVAEEAAPGADASPAATEEPPPRPESVPDGIPQWAWDLNEWHSASEAERGPRPEAAPRRVPEWYWEWRGWRAELAARAGS
jgi:hypothetical protein